MAVIFHSKTSLSSTSAWNIATSALRETDVWMFGSYLKNLIPRNVSILEQPLYVTKSFLPRSRLWLSHIKCSIKEGLNLNLWSKLYIDTMASKIAVRTGSSSKICWYILVCFCSLSFSASFYSSGQIEWSQANYHHTRWKRTLWSAWLPFWAIVSMFYQILWHYLKMHCAFGTTSSMCFFYGSFRSRSTNKYFLSLIHLFIFSYTP